MDGCTAPAADRHGAVFPRRACGRTVHESPATSHRSYFEIPQALTATESFSVARCTPHATVRDTLNSYATRLAVTWVSCQIFIDSRMLQMQPNQSTTEKMKPACCLRHGRRYSNWSGTPIISQALSQDSMIPSFAPFLELQPVCFSFWTNCFLESL